MSGYRPDYTQEDEKRIMDYIIEHNEYHRLKGDKLWKIMEEKKIINRTWQSMKQHFRHKMIHRLNYVHFKLSDADQKKIRYAYYGVNGQPEPPQLRPADANVETERKVPDFMAESSSSSSDSD